MPFLSFSSNIRILQSNKTFLPIPTSVLCSEDFLKYYIMIDLSKSKEHENSNILLESMASAGSKTVLGSATKTLTVYVQYCK